MQPAEQKQQHISKASVLRQCLHGVRSGTVLSVLYVTHVLAALRAFSKI